MSDNHGRVINFGAGPSALPLSVLEEAQKGLLNFSGTGIGIAEVSHRSKEFTAFVDQVEKNIRTLLDVPPTHRILLTQGGGTAQFSAVVLNLLARHRLLHPTATPEETTLDYVVTGSWSKKAAEEARRLTAGHATVRTVVDARVYSKDGQSFDNVPPHAEFRFSARPALVHYCENETVDGVEFAHDAQSPAAFPFDRLLETAGAGGGALVPLVADYSSSFLCRPIPRLADHAVIYAGAQKNLGPAGLAILIVREDCIVDVDAAARLGAPPVPLILSYKQLADHGSLYNTPSVFAIYVAGLVLERMKASGGLLYYEAVNKRKAQKLYAVIHEGEQKGLFRRKVQQGSESWMNVVFEVLGEGSEKKFLEGAEKEGMKGLKGHRSVGGIRVSLYNAITEPEVDKLIAFMTHFMKESSSKSEVNAV
ncbi:phosphoserine aminotransferase [Dichomitus squalens LYAD-421 SS1]|uniref:phosphoserine transaminase n=1 Tax=Dichomitus squalens TaxID=114155 RepID=A0A4Q9N742_9APHY|nr:phosphoserine aminotransferase [Dichomitus squalens LYAD-421 SS1]EJF65905.1 phosphoserine aminotransferase [Dichomitus squalens LYAD-421 SS1]TBU35927.1 phosphoserine aminotransferase [Dichomitus squalens]